MNNSNIEIYAMNNNQIIPHFASIKSSQEMIIPSQAPGVHRKKRRENFDYNETKLLLKFWGEPEMQENMKSNYLKTPFIEEIAVKMRMHGFNRSTKEVETRLRTMKCSYTRIIKDLDAGWIRKPTWKFFDDVHAILGSSVIKKEQFNQSAEPLDLSTSPTIKPDVHNLNCINPTAKAVIKRINSRTNMKKWIPVPLRIVKGETTTSQIPILTPQHPVPSNIHVNNDTSTEQVVLINENNNNSTETPIIRKKPSLLRDALENKDESNLVSINEKNIASILQIEQQRLEIEKERFRFEKFVGNTILSMCHSLIENSKK